MARKLLVEHKGKPGAIYKNRLIISECAEAVFNDMELRESADENGRNVIKFKGKFQEADAINKNRRTYPYMVLENNVKRLSTCIKEGGLIGELDHPSDSIIHFKEASHKITKLWWEGKTLMGEGEVLSTPCGRILQSLINDGVRVGISSRGVGNGKVNEEGILVIGESYKLITFDAVADPSTFHAFQERIKGKNENATPRFRRTKRRRKQDSNIKNESRGIYKCNKDLLVACLGGVITQTVDEYKARLS